MNWEYKTIGAKGGRVGTIDLDKLGQEGWELVSVDNGVAYFKREIRNVSKPIITRVVVNKEDGN